jgi:hypothetical protein
MLDTQGHLSSWLLEKQLMSWAVQNGNPLTSRSQESIIASLLLWLPWPHHFVFRLMIWIYSIIQSPLDQRYSPFHFHFAINGHVGVSPPPTVCTSCLSIHSDRDSHSLGFATHTVLLFWHLANIWKNSMFLQEQNIAFGWQGKTTIKSHPSKPSCKGGYVEDRCELGSYTTLVSVSHSGL